MGSLNCKERLDVGPIIETVFELSYMMLFVQTVDFVFHNNPLVTFGSYIAKITIDFFLSMNMLKLGSVVQCAIDNRIYGPETSLRFVDYSGEYMSWSFFYVLKYIFTDFVEETFWIVVANLAGLIGLRWVADGVHELLEWIDPVLSWTALALTLYLTNAVYEGFHPSLAPGLSNDYTGVMPSFFSYFTANN